MKILHFIYDHTGNPWVGGGGAVRAHEIYKRLAPRHDITVVTGRYPGAKDYEEGNLKFHFVGTGSNNYILSTFCYAFKAASFLRKHRDEADIVVEDFAPYNPLFSFVRRKDAVVQVHQKEGLHLLRRYWLPGVLFFLVERFYPRLFLGSVAVSELSKERFALHGAAVIPNGFDPALLEQTVGDRGYMLFLGRLHVNQKGLDTLAEALSALTPKTKLVIAGGGKDEEKTKALFWKLAAKGAVSMAGYVKGKEKADLLANCSFMVMPSRYEGQPLTAVEAAACGKPLVVSDIAELSFAAQEGFGLSFRTGDARDLAEKIKTLAGDASLREKMGARARSFARSRTWDRVAGQYEEFLEGRLTHGRV